MSSSGWQWLVESLRGQAAISPVSQFRPRYHCKWLELLKDIAPSVNLISAILDQGTSYVVRRAIANLAPSLHLKYDGLPVSSLRISSSDQIEWAWNRWGLDCHGYCAGAHGDAVVRLAAQHHVPTIYPFGYYAHLGGLYLWANGSIFGGEPRLTLTAFAGREPPTHPFKPQPTSSW